jgi:hypothetical protein
VSVSIRPAVPARAGPTPLPWPRRRAPLAVIGLVLLALTGCTIPGFSAKSGGSSESSDAAAGSGPTWFWYQEGNPVTSESAPAAARPASSTSTTTAPAAATATSTASRGSTCLKRLEPITRWLRATGGAGQGTLGWSHVDDPRVVEYKVAAVLQEHPGGDDLPAQTWTTVARPTSGCKEMTVTITGLISGRHYVFWLDALITTQSDGLMEPMIGRSNAFLVT